MFEPEELMARIVDLEAQLKVSEMAPPAAEQLIACLEGEIAKRDETIARLEPQLNRAIQANYDLREELAACRIAVENCEVFRARIAELEARIVWLECEAQVNAAPVSEPKAQGVVMPERKHYHDYLSLYDKGEAIGHNNALAEVARLNATPVQQVSVPEGWMLVPVNATEAILDVLYSNGMDESYSLLQDIWSAMLAAVQAAPAADASPENCRQRLASEGKTYPKSSCAACGQFSPKWRECDAALAAHRAKGVV